MSEALPNTQHATSQDAMSVSELTLRVKEAVESHFTDVWVTGEISNLVRASSGHTYLSLKDESSLLRAVIWRGTRQSLAIEPVDGLEVVCHGRLEVYAPRGSYQLTIDRLHAIGTGALETQLRKLHATLKAEGLFDLDQKRPLPTFPKRVALVTSPTGAAVMDFLETLLQRWPSTEVIVIPTRVQGAGAAEDVASALQVANRITPQVDIISLVRGGGSLEDLWAFNEEPLVRAVAASSIPVICGVGHEIDVSLADLAADQRALTPTDAAVKISPDGPQLKSQLEQIGPRLLAILKQQVNEEHLQLQNLANSWVFAQPQQLMHTQKTQLSDSIGRLYRHTVAAIHRSEERVAAATARLEADSPLKILARGFSITSKEDDPAALRSTVGIQQGTRLVSQLSDGRLWSRVERVENDQHQ
jgi:exodeoxyribonuclease VII large subunit